MSKISVLLVDDHKLIRESWNLLLSTDDRFEIVGETSDVEQATAVAASRKPQVVLMDINMTPVNGFEATKQVLKQSPHSQVIGVSMHSMPAYARRMFQVEPGAMLPRIHRKTNCFRQSKKWWREINISVKRSKIS